MPLISAEKMRRYRQAHPETYRAQQARWRSRHPDKVRQYQLKYRYGITPEEYDRLLDEQEHACAICGTFEPGGSGRFHVDHDHATGRVRGLLCHSCNRGVGFLADNAALLRVAATYLETQ